MATLKIWCWIYGDDPQRIFDVDISRAEPVTALREAIKSRNLNDFAHIDPDTVNLYCIPMPDVSNVKQALKLLRLKEEDSLDPVETLANLNLSGRLVIVHVLTLRYWIYGDKPHRIFEIKISGTATVAALTAAIVSEKPDDFASVRADVLDLYLVPMQDLGQWKLSDASKPMLPRELLSDLNLSRTLIVVVSPHVSMGDTQFSDSLHRVSLRSYIARSSYQYFALPPELEYGLMDELYQPYRGDAVDALYNYLQRNSRRFEQEEYYARFCSVVQSSGTGKTRTMLETHQDFLSEQASGGSGSGANDWKSVVKKWNSMCKLDSPDRPKFLQLMKVTYAELAECIGAPSAEEFVEYYSNVSPSLFRSAEAEMNTYCSKMTDVLSSTSHGPGVDRYEPRLVFALDEAHTLLDSPEFNRANALLRVIKEYPSHPAVWMMFASTTPRVAPFSAPQVSFFRPFCGVGWDQFAPDPGTVACSEVPKVKHILRYGRPLWASLENAGSSTSDIFDLASAKLTAPLPGRIPGVLSMLAQRFALDVSFGHCEAVGYVEASIASQLRVCIRTTEDRSWCYTIYPSEPFLSCAAAFQLHDVGRLKNALETLSEKVDNGMINIGERGELVSRLLWLLAKDFFVTRKKRPGVKFVQKDNEDELVHCQPIPVVEFFEFLFGDDFWTRAGAEAKRDFSNAFVSFSHWVTMDVNIHQGEEQDSTRLDEWTLLHWQRTSAIQCCYNQPLIDKVIPIYFKSSARNGDERNCMSQILISDKNRLNRQSGALAEIQRNDDSISGPDDYSKDFPWIAIVADLGRDEQTGVGELSYPDRESPREQKRPKDRSDNRCLRFRACGIGPDTYPFLQNYPVVRETLRHLIERQDVPDPAGRSGLAMQDRFRFGSSGDKRHMNWKQSDHMVLD